MAAMYGGGGGKAARAEKKENKKLAKEAAKTVKSVVKSMADKPSKADKPISLRKTLKGIENAKPAKRISDKTQAPLTSGTKSASTSGLKPMVRDLSSLDKFDKRIKLRQVPKEDKASAKAYNQRLKEKRKGK